MRLLCPFCQKPITVPDSEAGNRVPCPECNEHFIAPLLSTPSPSEIYSPQRQSAASSSTPVPETYASSQPYDHADAAETRLRQQPPPSPESELSDYRKIVSIPFKHDVMRWIAPAAMTLVFFLTMLPWDGMYLAGNSAYTQNAWQCAFGSVSYDPVAEQLMQFSAELDKRVHASLWLVPYLMLLFPALVLAWAGPIVEVSKTKLPPGLEPYWKFQPLILAGALGVMFLFLLAQCISGFGIQQGVDQYVEEMYKERRGYAKTPEQNQTLEMEIDSKRGSLRVKTTPWLRLAILFHLVGTLAAVAEYGLAWRGTKPPPRVAAMW
ncbi:MAG TPA: hypothetical protein VKD71_03645 [Gemmataceae bacterium]|nr:hypothetical protein [Gemmataceae bacterium]